MNYILPNFYHSYDCNKVILEEFPFKNIVGLEGDFCFNIFSGGPNNIYSSSLVVHEDVVQSTTDKDKIYLINMANCLISSEKYFYDEFTTVVLDELSEKNNCYFEIGNINFGYYLIKNYPNIKIILHPNFFLKHKFDIGLNFINENPNVKGIILNDIFFSENQINQLPDHLWKIGLVSLSGCYYCKSYQGCLAKDLCAIFDYSNQTTFGSCSKFQTLAIDAIKKQIDSFEEKFGIEYIFFEEIVGEHQFEEYKIIEKMFEEDLL